jgi:hypothetical protein
MTCCPGEDVEERFKNMDMVIFLGNPKHLMCTTFIQEMLSR